MVGPDQAPSMILQSDGGFSEHKSLQQELHSHPLLLSLQDLLRRLGLLDMFPYLQQGLSGETLEPAPQNPGEKAEGIQVGELSGVILWSSAQYALDVLHSNIGRMVIL